MRWQGARQQWNMQIALVEPMGEHRHSGQCSCDLASPKSSFVLAGIYGSVVLMMGQGAIDCDVQVNAC